VFDLLWRLISHDVWFVWERLEFLQHEDMDVICQVVFKVSCRRKNNWFFLSYLINKQFSKFKNFIGWPNTV
jgi:hypothetical protein